VGQNEKKEKTSTLSSRLIHLLAYPFAEREKGEMPGQRCARSATSNQGGKKGRGEKRDSSSSFLSPSPPRWEGGKRESQTRAGKRREKKSSCRVSPAYTQREGGGLRRRPARRALVTEYGWKGGREERKIKVILTLGKREEGGREKRERVSSHEKRGREGQGPDWERKGGKKQLHTLRYCRPSRERGGGKVH